MVHKEAIDWPGTCAAIIPCLNEAVSISDVVSRTLPYLPSIFVVDDGSSDGTRTRAETAGATIIRHGHNLGKGMALRTGLRRAREFGFNRALTLDGDGQHAPEDIPNLFAAAERTDAALVVGDRLSQRQKIPWVRRFTNLWMTARISRFTGVPVADSQCGFRLINLDDIEPLRLETRHFEFESELLVECLRAGLKVEFVSVQTIYQKGKSEIRPIADAWRWLCWWFAQDTR